MLSAESAQILCDYAVDFSVLCVQHHTLKIRSVKISSAPPVVHIFIIHDKLVFLCILPKNGSLGFNACAVAERFIVTAETHV